MNVGLLIELVFLEIVDISAYGKEADARKIRN